MVHLQRVYQRGHSLKLEEDKKLILNGVGLQDLQSSQFDVQAEFCFCIETSKELTDLRIIHSLVGDPFGGEEPQEVSSLKNKADLFSDKQHLVEYGPRLNFSTPFSTNAVSILCSAGIRHVTRVECFRSYLLTISEDCNVVFDEKLRRQIDQLLHDQMTETVYSEPIKTFELKHESWQVYDIKILEKGRKALEEANVSLGLAMDDWDIDYYTSMFTELGRNPSVVECFDLAQSNSEHSRHWFFSGRMFIEGEEQPNSLFSMVKQTQNTSNQNNKIKFNDNSSCIEGYRDVEILRSVDTDGQILIERVDKSRDLIFTAETHNFPTGVAPFPGATTGTGGRIRDVQATGRGAHVVAGTAGYCVGNLNIPGYVIPGEDKNYEYPPNFSSPLNIIIQASNGASDYGNKFGEPVICGFTRSFGLTCNYLNKLERVEWIKPVMFSAGLGYLDAEFTRKKTPTKGDLVVKVGGPVYRIGVGGGAASSMTVQGDDSRHELDLGAVQRGDAEMEQKMNRVIRACIEREDNPILSIHDQGAGGNGNVLKEICEPNGAVIYADQFSLGDNSINLLELWVAEYQESNALLVDYKQKEVLKKIAEREKCPVNFVGEITDDGKIKLQTKKSTETINGGNESVEKLPVNLDLQQVLASMPKKKYDLNKYEPDLQPLILPDELTVEWALQQVLRLPSVCSKRFLTNKVDRSVTGLIAQQQCVGPLHTPLADVAVTAVSYWSTVGAATAIGEQPIKSLVNPAAGARMSVGEALTNLVWAPISDIKDIKCSVNWMWPAKLDGEGARMYGACRSMCELMKNIGIAVDGGKDSLSMAARVNNSVVKSPGSCVVSCYVKCTDITKIITPDLKCPSDLGTLIYINLSAGQTKQRLGGTALAQALSQIGNTTADIEDERLFVRTFNTVQQLINDELISAGHDVSDGGVIVSVLEMCFSGNCGCDVTLPAYNQSDTANYTVISALFHEELGLVLEISGSNLDRVERTLKENDIIFCNIGNSYTNKNDINVSVRYESDGLVEHIFTSTVQELRNQWEETSFQLEMRQSNPSTVRQEKESLASRKHAPFKLTFDSADLSLPVLTQPKPLIAVIREEGSNGDREMSAAFITAGFQVYDVTMTDLIEETFNLNQVRGIAFVGGFSYADVFGSAKGWAASVLYHADVKRKFDEFYSRSDTFSLGVCNGCQLMTLLGWVGHTRSDIADSKTQVFMTHNDSGRYESRFSTVKISDSPAVMFRDMNDSVLGIWVAHGEGKMVFKSDSARSNLTSDNLIPLRYVNDEGETTNDYPFNPNGSPDGAAAICSLDGRHLAMMPHPERCFMNWQWPYLPADWNKMTTSPWIKMFQNAYQWCLEN